MIKIIKIGKIIRTPVVRFKELNYKKSKYSNCELSVILSSIKSEYLFESLDQKMVDLGRRNRNIWFKNVKNKVLYKSVFEDDDTIKFKIINGMIPETMLNNEELSGCENLVLVIELVGIWIIKNKYGLYMRLKEIHKKETIDYILSESS